MEVLVYGSEKFQRGKWRYVAFSTIFIAVFLLTVFSSNYVGAVLLFFLLWWYLYYSVIHNQVQTLRIDNQWLAIGTQQRSWSSFSWYVLELYIKDKKLKNIVFVSVSGHTIYTFADTPEHIKQFLLELNKYLLLLDDYNQTGFEKMIRKFQL
jgi:hypothetical protein